MERKLIIVIGIIFLLYLIYTGNLFDTLKYGNSATASKFIELEQKIECLEREKNGR